MEESSKLKLIVEKGPKEGETLDCVPGSVIRIGRVVRGNTFAIKDAGISSKHLLIKFKVGKWVVSDLDTSNGTMLNGVKLRALVDFDLRDGDIIKIGEWTSFKVEIEDDVVVVTMPKKKKTTEEEVPADVEKIGVASRLRRNPRRRAAPAPSTTRVSKDDEASESASVSVPQVPKISEISNLGIQNCEGTDNVAVVADIPTKRRGRGKPKKISKDEHAVSASTSIAEVQKNSNIVVLESVKEPENAVPAEEKRIRRGAPRKTKTKASSKDVPTTATEVQELPESSNTGVENYEVFDNVPAPLVKKQQTRRVAPKRTRATKKDEALDSVTEMPKVLENLSIAEPLKFDRMEVDQTQAVAKKKGEPLESVAEMPKVLENLSLEEPHKLDRMEENQTQRRTNDFPDQPSSSVRIPEVLEIPETSNPQEETCKESINTATNENPVPPKAEKIGNIIDWEKMTLGEWFDYLEIYLPRQINEATDEIISNMRERSKQFNEFMSQHQGGKGKLPMS